MTASATENLVAEISILETLDYYYYYDYYYLMVALNEQTSADKSVMSQNPKFGKLLIAAPLNLEKVQNEQWWWWTMEPLPKK